MKMNKIKVLALACLVLAVIGTGNAFAYSWGSQDYSILTAPNTFQKPDTATGTPYGGSPLSWQNKVQNGWAGVFYPTIFWSDPFGYWDKDPSSTGLAPEQTPSIYMPETTQTQGSGTITLTVQHRYGYTPDSNTYATSFEQDYYR